MIRAKEVGYETFEDVFRTMWAGETSDGHQKPRVIRSGKPGKTWRMPETVERQEKVKRMVEEGLTVPEMCKVLGVSSGSVWYDLRYMGLEPKKVRYHERKQSVETRERRKKVAQILKSGDVKARDIAQRFGISKQAAQRDIRIIRGGNP